MSNQYREIGRVLLFLFAFRRFQGKWFGLTDICTLTGLPKTTVWNNLKGFVHHGVLEYEPATQKYRSMPAKK